MCSSYDIVGDITIIRLREASKIRRRKIAEALMNVHKNVKTVFAQTGAVCGDFRLRKLEYVAGERVITTVHRESGVFSLLMLKNAIFHLGFFMRECELQGRLEKEKLW